MKETILMNLIDITDENIEAFTRRAYEVSMAREIDNLHVQQSRWSELDDEEKDMRIEFVKDLCDAINYCIENGKLK